MIWKRGHEWKSEIVVKDFTKTFRKETPYQVNWYSIQYIKSFDNNISHY